MLDMTITHPSTPSRTSLQPLADVKEAEARKFHKYCNLASAHGATNYGFALETFGAFAPNASTVLKVMEQQVKGQKLGLSSSDPRCDSTEG